MATDAAPAILVMSPELVSHEERGPPDNPQDRQEESSSPLELKEEHQQQQPMQQTPAARTGSDRQRATTAGGTGCGLLGSVRFHCLESPGMSRSPQVRYLMRFRLGDTYKLKTRSWLIPQFLSGALILTGVVLTLVGIISLQINKYLHACDAEDGIDCKSNKADINNVMMPIGVGTTGGGLSLILISGFVFVHAFCVIYEDAENESGAHEGVLHIPVSARAALLGSTNALVLEPVAQSQSYYDNLQGYTGQQQVD